MPVDYSWKNVGLMKPRVLIGPASVSLYGLDQQLTDLAQLSQGSFYIPRLRGKQMFQIQKLGELTLI
jgi:hypothetical protein